MLAVLIAACSAGSEPTATSTATPTPDVTIIPTFTGEDGRPIVALPDGGTGTIDNWDVTASFDETTAPYGYGERRVDFRVHIEWTGEDTSGELMAPSFLENSMWFVSPSGKTASVHLRRSDDIERLEVDPVYDGWAYNGSDSLPDEAGAFLLIFAPHPYKRGLGWRVELPHLGQ